MNKKFKRAVSLLLILTMFLGIIPTNSVAQALKTGPKDASENTYFEDLDYSRPYNFDLLLFSPDVVDRDESSNEINFEVYGRQNIAASTNNWVINLQIDERLAKYIDKITVNNVSGVERTFTRKNDSLGRSTNIWQVNYIRGAGGLFAGGETTDTQVAQNGVITFKKDTLNNISIKEILDEINFDKDSEKLFYRIYMTSNQDGGRIVPKMEGTGTFFVDGVDETLDRPISQGNETWFMDSNVSAKFMSGQEALGEYGAIVVDQTIAKTTNFAYGLSAKNKEWTIKYGIDPKLEPYIAGIDLWKMEGVNRATPDLSFGGKNKIAAALSINRDKSSAEYGYGEYQTNDFRNLVELINGGARPPYVRYVYKLNKPINEVLKDLKEKGGYEAGDPYTNYFKFESWFSDRTKVNVIPQTYAYGSFYIQDLDGDGIVDSEESRYGNSPYISIPELKNVYEGDNVVKASVYLHEFAGEENQVELVNKFGETVAITTVSAIDDENKPYAGDQEITFKINDPTRLGKTGDQLIIRVIPKDTRYIVPEVSDTIIKEVPKAAEKIIVPTGEDLTGDTEYAKMAIVNSTNFPEGTTYKWKTTPDTSKDGKVDATVIVTVPGREDRPFEVPITLDVNADVYYQPEGGEKPAGTPDNYVKVFFDLDGKGKLAPGYVTTLWVNPAKELTVIPPIVIPERGYVFDKWDQSMTQTFTEETTIKASYKEILLKEQPMIEQDGQFVPDSDYVQINFRPAEGNFKGKTDGSANRYWILKGHSFDEQDAIKVPVPEREGQWAFDKWSPDFDASEKINEDSQYLAEYKRTLADIEPVTDTDSSVPEGYVRITLKETEGVGFFPEDVAKIYDVNADGSVRYFDVYSKVNAAALAEYENLRWFEEEKPLTGAERVLGTDPITLTAKADPESGIIPVTDNTKPIRDGFTRVHLVAGEGIKVVTGTMYFDVQTDGSVRYSDILQYVYDSPNTKAEFEPNYRKPFVFTIDGAEIIYSSYPIENTEITIGATKNDNLVYIPQGTDQTVKKGDEVDPKNSITNVADMPKGTKYAFIDSEGKEISIDTSELGEQSLKVRVTFPDGTFADVTPKIIVIPTEEMIDVSDLAAQIPRGYIRVKFGEDSSVVYADNAIKAVDIKVDKDFRFADVYSRVEVKPAEGYKEPIEWYNGDTKVDSAGKISESLETGNSVLTLMPKAVENDSTAYEPAVGEQKVVQDTEILAKDFITNREDMPVGTAYSFIDENGDPAIVDTSKIGKRDVKVQVKFPDGTIKVLDTKVNVIPKDDFIKVNDESEKTPEGYVRVKLVNDTTSVNTFNEIYDVKEGYKLGDVLLRAGDPQPAENYKEPVVWKNGNALVNIKDAVSNITLTATATIEDAGNTAYKPLPQNKTVKQGDQVIAEDFIANKDVMPNGTSYKFVNTEDSPITITTENVGTQDLIIEVVYLDGSTAQVKASLKVETSKDILEVTEPTSDVPTGFARVTLVKGEGVNFDENAVKVYDVRKDANIRYADIYSKVGAKVSEGYKDLRWYNRQNLVTGLETVKDTLILTARATKTNTNEFTPRVEAQDVVQETIPTAADFITNKDELPKGTYYEFVDESGKEVDVDTTDLGEQILNIKVSYPDGTSQLLEVTMNVVEKDGDIIPVEDISKDPKAGYRRVTFKNLDGVTTITGKNAYDVKTDGSVRYAEILDLIRKENPDIIVNIADTDKYRTPFVFTIEGSDVVESAFPQNDTTITVGATKCDKDAYDVEFTDQTVKQNQVLDPNNSVTNLDKLPANTRIEFIDDNGNSIEPSTIDTSKLGDTTVKVKVTYPDGSFVTQQTTIKVVPKENIIEVTDTTTKAPDGYVRVNFGPDNSVVYTENAIKAVDIKKGTDVKYSDVYGRVSSEVRPDDKYIVPISWYLEDKLVSPDGRVMDAVGENTATLTLTPKASLKNSEKYTPIGQEQKIPKGTDTSEVLAKNSIKNIDEMPLGTKYEFVKAPDLNKLGKQNVQVKVIFPDGTEKALDTTINVVPTEDIIAVVDEAQEIPDGYVRIKLVGDTTSVQSFSTVFDVKANSNYRLGDIIGKISVQPNADYQGPIVWKTGDTEVDKLAAVDNVTLTAYATKQDSAEYNPLVETKNIVQGTIPKAEDFITNKASLPKGTEFEFIGEVDTTSLGMDKPITIKVTYPDGTSKEVTTTMNVVEAEKDIVPVTDTSEDPQEGYARITLVNGEGVNFEENRATIYDVKKDANVRFADIYDKVNASPADGYTEVKWYKGDNLVKGTETITETLTLTAKAVGNNATIYEPVTETMKVVQGTTPKASDFITNKADLPKGTEFTFIGTPDTNDIGEKTVKIKVTYPDGTSEEVTEKMNVIAKDKLKEPTIVTPSQGDTNISGTAIGASTIDIVITGADGAVRATISNKAVNPDGSFNIPVNALQDGDIIKVLAKADGKDSSEGSVTVGLELDSIRSAVARVDATNLDTNNAFDKDLQDKLNAAKDVIARAEDNNTANDPRQADVDRAQAELIDALNKKDANDKVVGLEDKVKADPMTLPTNEEIRAAQDAIDKIEGSLEIGSSDFNQVKKELQDRLDLVEAIKKAEEALNDPDNADKPAYQKDPVIETVQAAKTSLNNGDIINYQELIIKIEQVVKELEQDAIIITVDALDYGMKTLRIQTSVNKASIVVKLNGEEIFTGSTDSFGRKTIGLTKALEENDEIEIIATKEGYNDGKYLQDVY